MQQQLIDQLIATKQQHSNTSSQQQKGSTPQR